MALTRVKTRDQVKVDYNFDMNGKRAVNAQDAIDPQDFVTLTQLEGVYEDSELEDVDFDVETGDLTISQSAHFVSTNLDGRYRLSKKIEDVVGETITTLELFPWLETNGAYIDYLLHVQSTGAKRVGRIMAAWDDSGVLFTDYSSPELNGIVPVQVFLQLSGSNIALRVDSTISDVFVRFLITTI